MELIYLFFSIVGDFFTGLADGFAMLLTSLDNFMNGRPITIAEGHVYRAGWLVGLYLFWMAFYFLYIRKEE